MASHHVRSLNLSRLTAEMTAVDAAPRSCRAPPSSLLLLLLLSV